MNRYGIAALLLALAFGIAWYTHAPDIPPRVTVEAKPAKELAKESTVPLIVDLVKVYPPAVKSRLGLPAAVVSDSGQHVVASSKVKPGEHPHTITTTLNQATGQFTTYDRTDPLPWLAVGGRGAVGISYALKNGTPAGQLYGYRDLLQIKALHAGVRGNIDTDKDWSAGGYIEYRF